MFRTIGLLLLLAPTLLSAGEAGWPGASVRTPHVELHLEAEHASVKAGQTFWVGLRFDLAPQWHVYWRNPGDSGEAPRVQWQLPDGWQAGEVHWPVPKRIRIGPLVNLGYEDSVTLLAPIQVAHLPSANDSARITAQLTWLVCREECIPESGSLQIELPLSSAASVIDPAAAGRFALARSRLPMAFPGSARYETEAAGTLRLRLRTPGWPTQRIDDLWFASADWGPVAVSGTQPWATDGDELVLKLPPGEAPLADGEALRGLLVMTEQTGDGRLTRGFDIRADAVTPPGTSVAALWIALGLALVGGLLLNLMPCVLPVLAIKVLGLVHHAGGAGARHGLVFAAGVLTTFAALAALLLSLRAGGAALGWGFQLQEPLVIIGLLYLMLVLALNLSGVYAIGGGMAGVGQGLAGRTGLGGTFATGVLAVVVASPCTAPFMGGAIGFAITRPPGEAVMVFLALGAGFALPVLALSVWPRWIALLPPPGAWMERLRHALAFPMYGAAAWLLWVLSQQIDAETLAAVLAGAVLLSFALWWYGQALDNRRRQLIVSLAGISAAIGLAAMAATSQPIRQSGPQAERWSTERVEQLRREGRPVLVNFTAAWCITCKLNERVALGTDSVQTAMRERGIAYLKGDWTRRDAAITAELQRHGRSGVPLYLFYPRGDGRPAVLPQLLTEGLILNAIENTHYEE